MKKLEITKEKVLEAASNCSQAKEVLKTMFPEVFEEEVESYEEICEKLMQRSYYSIDNIEIWEGYDIDGVGNESKDKQQLEHLLCLNKLINVARYLNENSKESDRIYSFNFIEDSRIKISHSIFQHCGIILFKSKELAEKALKILGEETIRKALTLNF